MNYQRLSTFYPWYGEKFQQRVRERYKATNLVTEHNADSPPPHPPVGIATPLTIKGLASSTQTIP